MVNLFKRMRKLNTRLLNVRIGTGAAVLPSIANSSKDQPAITRIHLTYAKRMNGGHMGARRFWRQCLPRLKFHNPAIQMSVKQTDDQEGPAALTIFFSGQPRNTQHHTDSIEDKYAPAPSDSEKTIVLDVKNNDYSQIWQKVKEATGAEDIQATEKEQEELENFRNMDIKSEQDRIRVAGIRQAKKDQERMLQEARGEVEKLRQL
ncbi:50S ribosomal protein Mrp49 [Talaromyces proteolyticus]|uniref:50S ribosomal protein Mrp49 n=1 Tax=Talaromyces proteolyticus TaxID=1131652 RepID=A0AAD4L063_9EURO|nr:50S ribosomal protein Mrp49 [Talaromyces proteolyticus]KAH8701681.1 50S ribosomal protein Mrp49 [Talaromyces proteolyticus]